MMQYPMNAGMSMVAVVPYLAHVLLLIGLIALTVWMVKSDKMTVLNIMKWSFIAAAVLILLLFALTSASGVSSQGSMQMDMGSDDGMMDMQQMHEMMQ